MVVETSASVSAEGVVGGRRSALCSGRGPKVARDFRTKAQLALEMVRANRRRGVRFAWVGIDVSGDMKD